MCGYNTCLYLWRDERSFQLNKRTARNLDNMIPKKYVVSKSAVILRLERDMYQKKKHDFCHLCWSLSNNKTRWNSQRAEPRIMRNNGLRTTMIVDHQRLMEEHFYPQCSKIWHFPSRISEFLWTAVCYVTVILALLK